MQQIKFPYESLAVYQKALSLNQEVYRLLKRKSEIPSYLKNQLGRATMSILLNIAEGSGKFTDRDKKNFYIVSRGSAYECAAIIQFLERSAEIDENISNDLRSKYEEISKMLFGMVKVLKTSASAQI